MDIYNRIRLLWNHIREVTQQGPGDEYHSQEREQTSPPLIRSELHIPETVIKRYDAGDEWNKRLQIGTLVTGIVGLLALLATLYETRRAVNVAIDSAHSDKRAWVGLGEIEVLGKPTAGQSLGVRAGVRNSGESPSIHTFTYGIVSLWKSVAGDIQIPLIKDPRLASCKGPKPRQEDALGGSMVIPGANGVSMHRLSQVLPEKIVNALLNGLTIEVSDEDLDSIPTFPNTPPETKQWTVRIYLVGCINYFDVFGEVHRTSFCYQYGYERALETLLPNGAFLTCNRGNDAD